MNTQGMNTLYFHISFHRKGQTVIVYEGKVSRSDRAKYLITPGQIGKFDTSSKTVGEFVQQMVERQTFMSPPPFAAEIDAQPGPVYTLDMTKYFPGEDGSSYLTCFVSELPKTPITELTYAEKNWKYIELITAAIGALEEHEDESTVSYIRSEMGKM